jgi:hypothetical protein
LEKSGKKRYKEERRKSERCGMWLFVKLVKRDVRFGESQELSAFGAEFPE